MTQTTIRQFPIQIRNDSAVKFHNNEHNDNEETTSETMIVLPWKDKKPILSPVAVLRVLGALSSVGYRLRLWADWLVGTQGHLASKVAQPATCCVPGFRD